MNKNGLLNKGHIANVCLIRVITKLPNSEQSYKGKIKTLFISI